MKYLLMCIILFNATLLTSVEAKIDQHIDVEHKGFNANHFTPTNHKHSHTHENEEEHRDHHENHDENDNHKLNFNSSLEASLNFYTNIKINIPTYMVVEMFQDVKLGHLIIDDGPPITPRYINPYYLDPSSTRNLPLLN